MTYPELVATPADSPSLDAFGRQRSSSPTSVLQVDIDDRVAPATLDASGANSDIITIAATGLGSAATTFGTITYLEVR